MAISDLVAKVNEPAFYTKVLFIALKVAQNVASESEATTDHAARVAYANRIFRGQDSAALIAAHIIAANATIQNVINAGNEPSDSDIEFVFGEIWTARAKAFE